MIGGTLKGLSWGNGDPFIDSVVLMEPYWLWRAIGGTLMWFSHIVFAYNFYKMIKVEKEVDVNEATLQILQSDNEDTEIEKGLNT